MKRKIKEIPYWEINDMFQQGKNTGQKPINKIWGHHREVKEGRMMCKARLFATGSKEANKNMDTGALTCVPETLV